jgi:GNAT superfamily N-acetyltransferase
VTAPNRLRLRDYVSEDFDGLVERWHATNLASYPYNEEQQRHTLEGARRFFAANVVAACRIEVATMDGELTGFMALEAPWIRHLAVVPGHQRRGVGAALLAWAREQSPRELRLFTFQRNEPARRFYEKHGFTAVAFGVSPAPESEPDVEYHWTA